MWFQKIMSKLYDAILSFYSSKGDLSFGRLMTGYIVTAVLAWDTAYVYFAWKMNINHPELHLSLIDMLPNTVTLAGQVVFMTAFYVSTKVQEYKLKSTAGDATVEKGESS